MAGLSNLQELGVVYGVPLARALMAAVFLYSGQDKIRHWRAGVEEVAGLGMPMPQLFAAATIVVQIVGGLSVLSGIGLFFGAAVLALFTAAATILGHRFWLLHGQPAKQELTTTLEHLAIVGGLLLLAVSGLQQL
jgi:putative oxidoreductase